MILFASAVVFAGIAANDPLITAMGVFILVIGIALFAFRQLQKDFADDESGITAGVVSFRAPAALVAVVVGALLLLIGRGALTVGNLANATDEQVASPPPSVAVPTTESVTTTTEAPATTTTQPPTSTTRPPQPVDPATPGELPMTGAEDLLPLGVAFVAGGRWLTLSVRP